MTTIAPPSLTWPEWKDALGQTFKPGDLVAYAYTVYRHAGIQFGIVDRINRYKKNGTEITGIGRWNNGNYVPGSPSCTVTVIPVEKFEDKWTINKIGFVSDSQGRRRAALTDGQNSPKTWQKPENIIKINIEMEEL